MIIIIIGGNSAIERCNYLRSGTRRTVGSRAKANPTTTTATGRLSDPFLALGLGHFSSSRPRRYADGTITRNRCCLSGGRTCRASRTLVAHETDARRTRTRTHTNTNTHRLALERRHRDRTENLFIHFFFFPRARNIRVRAQVFDTDTAVSLL